MGRMSRFARRLARAVLALVAAGFTGAGVMSLLLVLADLDMGIATGGERGLGAALVGLVAFPFWLAGAFIVGPPIWAVLHLIGWRHRRTAVAAGSVVASLGLCTVLWIITDGGLARLDAATAGALAALSGVAALSGAVAGRVLHAVAYGSTGRAR